MPKAVLINAYSVRNAGDAAIMLATAKLLRDMGYERIDVSSRHWEEDKLFYDRYKIGSIPPIVEFPIRGSASSLERIVRFAASSIAGSVMGALLGALLKVPVGSVTKRLNSRLQPAAQSDLIVLAGGGYLYSANRRVNLTLMHIVVQIIVARLLRKPILMMPQSVGPLHRKVDQRLVRWALNSVSPLVVRDQESIRTCNHGLRWPKDKIVILPDIVFYGLPDSPSSTTAHGSATVGDVLLVVMDWTWARNVGSMALDHYVEKLADTARRLVGHGLTVSLAGNSRMPEQAQDDFAVAAQVMRKIGPDVAGVTMLDADTGMHDLIQVMQQTRVVIGTRLHSCILSLVSGTPTIALAYQPKTIGTFQLLEMAAYAHDVETFLPEDIVSQAVSLVTDESTERLKVENAVSRQRHSIYAHYIGSCETLPGSGSASTKCHHGNAARG